jgi:ATP-binding cassette subfamily B protein
VNLNSAPNGKFLLHEEFSPRNDPFRSARQKGTTRWIIAHLLYGSNGFMVLLALFASILASILSSLTYVFFGQALDGLIRGESGILIKYTILIFICSVGSPLLNLFFNFIREVVAQAMERDARHEFFTGLLGKSQSFHDQQRIGELMALTAEDVRMLNYMVSPGLSLIIQSAINLIVPLAMVWTYYPPILMLTPGIFTIFFLFALRNYIDQLGPASVQLRTEFGNMDATLTEMMTGIDVIKSTTAESRELNKFMKNVNGYKSAFIERAAVEGRYIPLLFFGFALAGGLAHSLSLVGSGTLEIGQVIAYMGILFNFRFPTFVSIWVFALIRMAVASADRILDKLNQSSEIPENKNGLVIPLRGEIEFQNVTFIYPGATKPTLKNISFRLQAGQTIAIVGTTGSGKTTLTKLIARLYDIHSGKILIDGHEITEYSLRGLRRQIAFIEQDIYLFSSSIRENIAFGRHSETPITDDEIIQAAKDAQADIFIQNLPEKYASEIGPRGVQLSGGERQRIAIARALLADPRILIVDDATSAIDSATEEQIQRAFQKIMKGRTTFLITHRLSQIRWADQIMVLKQGELIAIGNHTDLIKNCKEYQEIFLRRFDLSKNHIKEGL